MPGLAPHIHLAVIGDDVVLLDVAADRYICVPGGREQLSPSSDRGSVSPSDPEVLAEMAGAGYLSAATGFQARPVCTRPAQDFGGPSVERLTAREALRLGGALCDLGLRYRARSLVEILAFATRKPCAPVSVSRHVEALRLARLFDRVAVWLPMPRKCLARSFVLLRFLQRSGLNAAWVFGVRTWPFSAHCWLQVGDLALDDHWERLLAYEPIMVVG